MNDPRFLRHIEYRNLLDDRVPITSYSLYENDHHRFIFLKFHNSTISTILKFKIKFTFYNQERKMVSESAYEFQPSGFYSHQDFVVGDPILMPKEAENFNYTIYDVEAATVLKPKEEKLKIVALDAKTKHHITKTKPHLHATTFWLLGAVTFGVIAVGLVPFTISFMNSGVKNAYFSYSLTRDKINYRFYDENDAYSITGNEDYDQGDLKIPGNINGYPVYSINTSSFTDNSKIATLYSEGTLNNIGTYAFSNCKNLFSVDVECSYFEAGCFYNCSSLNKVSLYNVKNIAKGAFSNCTDLKDVYIDNYDAVVVAGAFPDGVNITYGQNSYKKTMFETVSMMITANQDSQLN